jgi:hypothetical protein
MLLLAHGMQLDAYKMGCYDAHHPKGKVLPAAHPEVYSE